jgi:nitrite reductase/ring-hydroxylating ferredoxin subunit
LDSQRRNAPLLVAIALVVVVTVAGITWVLSSRGSCAELGPVDSFELNTVTAIRCLPAFVVNRNGNLAVYLARAPHLRGEPLRWDATRRLFVSPFHGESFEVDGKKVAGPGGDHMFECPTKVEDGSLVIDAADDASIDEIRTICGYEDLPP